MFSQYKCILKKEKNQYQMMKTKKKKRKKKTMATHVFQPIKCLKNKHTKG